LQYSFLLLQVSEHLNVVLNLQKVCPRCQNMSVNKSLTGHVQISRNKAVTTVADKSLTSLNFEGMNHTL
jgi:hypothetical protein